MENQVILLNSWHTSKSTITLKDFRELGIRDGHKYVPKAHEIQPPYQMDFRLPRSTLSVVTDTQLYEKYHNVRFVDDGVDLDQYLNQDQDADDEEAEKAYRMLYSGEDRDKDPRVLDRQYLPEIRCEAYNALEPQVSVEVDDNQDSLPNYFTDIPIEEHNLLEPPISMEVADFEDNVLNEFLYFHGRDDNQTIVKEPESLMAVSDIDDNMPKDVVATDPQEAQTGDEDGITTYFSEPPNDEYFPIEAQFSMELTDFEDSIPKFVLKYTPLEAETLNIDTIDKEGIPTGFLEISTEDPKIPKDVSSEEANNNIYGSQWGF